MKISVLVTSMAFSSLFMLMPSLAPALTITDQNLATAGLQFTEGLNDGVFITDNAAAPNTFNANVLINMNNGTETNDGVSPHHADPIPFSAIPYVLIDSIYYFQFIFDMQESGNALLLNIDDLVLTAGVAYPSAPASGGTVVWDYDQLALGSIVLNNAAPYTNTPQGAGGDMALYVPVSLFDDLGLTNGSLLTMTVTQSSAHGGDDEWALLESGPTGFPSGGGGSGQDVTPVPEPGTVVLLGSGLLGLFYMARRRRRQ